MGSKIKSEFSFSLSPLLASVWLHPHMLSRCGVNSSSIWSLKSQREKSKFLLPTIHMPHLVEELKFVYVHSCDQRARRHREGTVQPQLHTMWKRQFPNGLLAWYVPPPAAQNIHILAYTHIFSFSICKITSITPPHTHTHICIHSCPYLFFRASQAHVPSS